MAVIAKYQVIVSYDVDNLLHSVINYQKNYNPVSLNR